MNTCATCRFVYTKPAINDLVFCKWLNERVGAGPVPKCIPSDWDFLRLVCYPDDPCDSWESRA